ncbi:MAG: stage II sporulation protein M [Candidatus Diapherotrites archaeon]|nr:stage II sporulation protein M [Candidatus Diapherotrites archaeon]
MLESLINPEVAEKRPYEVMFLAFIMAVVSMGMATLVGRGAEVSHLAVAFICIGAAPLMVHAIRLEAKEDELFENESEFNILHRHGDMLEIYGYYFLGVILAFSLMYVILPSQPAYNLFAAQSNELNIIHDMRGTGNVAKPCGFFCIFQNNLEVLILATIFSFVFGAGAVYIITWNASIVGVFVGIMAKELAAKQGYNVVMAYLIALPVALISLFPHGIFEIGAYFFGGLAGGMLSASLLRGKLGKKVVIRDIATMFLLAVLFVAIGAVIETS